MATCELIRARCEFILYNQLRLIILSFVFWYIFDFRIILQLSMERVKRIIKNAIKNIVIYRMKWKWRLLLCFYLQSLEALQRESMKKLFNNIQANVCHVFFHLDHVIAQHFPPIKKQCRVACLFKVLLLL